MNQASFGEIGPASPKPFNVVVAYDSNRGARKVMQWVDQLLAKSGETEVHRHLLGFETLSASAEGKAAAESAAKADLLILVARGDTDLPKEVKTWLKAWAENSDVDGSALLAFFHGKEKSVDLRTSPQQFLQSAAARAHHPFFHHRLKTFENAMAWPADDSKKSFTDSDRNSEGGFHERDWGLNE